ncbi:MAG TPA: hypothetical protein VHM19_10295, partial [Polyangiales bacterium]|nr:hypothetical protein [Polyangiales bacterium]
MSERSARACWIVAPGRAELRAEALVDPKPGEVLIETTWSGVSRGTESRIFQHDVPTTEHQRMRAPFQDGTLPGPVKYGYASVGRVRAGDPSLEGRAVFCLYPHQTAYVVPRSSVVPLPEGIPEERAVLGANLETALNALWDAQPLIGQRIVVVGGGVVGSLVAYLAARIPGCDVCLVDVLPERARIAAAIDCRFCSVESALHVAADADLVVHA